MALAWECKIEFVCASLMLNAQDIIALSQLNTFSILQAFLLKLFHLFTQ